MRMGVCGNLSPRMRFRVGVCSGEDDGASGSSTASGSRSGDEGGVVSSRGRVRFSSIASGRVSLINLLIDPLLL